MGTRRRRWAVWAIAACAAAGLVAGGVVLVTRATATTPGADVAAAAARGRAIHAPWTLPRDVEASARAAGLAMLTHEGTVMHIHQHLSITVDGTPITVPADLGIDVDAHRLSALHTHDTSGILHVESPVVKTFRLDQAFAEWDIRLAPATIGPYVGGRDGVRVSVFVDQRPYRADPRGIVLRRREDIDFVVTTDGSTPTAPPAFAWPSNY